VKVKRLSAGPALRGKRLVPLLTFELRHSIILTNSARERACVLSIARAVTAVAASPMIYDRTDSFTVSSVVTPLPKRHEETRA
jgi:hypothetical protein